MVANPSKPDNLDAREREERHGEAIQRVVVRGQAAGEFSTEIPPMWGASAVGALLVAAIRGVGEGRIRREDAHPLLIRPAIGVLRPGARAAVLGGRRGRRCFGRDFFRRWVVAERDHRDPRRHERPSTMPKIAL